EDALVGIVYRWPVEWWQDHIDAVFQASEDFPWLQRQVIFKTGEAERFLARGAIADPVTELYVRARYNLPATAGLIDAAIDRVKAANPLDYENSRRAGLVAWCLGRIGALEKIRQLPQTGLTIEELFQIEMP